MSEMSQYMLSLENNDARHEQMCRRCGICCGLNNDPCENLVKVNDSTFICRDYDNRFGKHQTVSGREFTCVSIRDLMKKGATPITCAYNTSNGMQ